MEKDLKIINAKAMQKFLVLLTIIVFDTMFLIAYIVGFEDPTVADSIIIFSIIGGITIVGLVTYIIVRRCYKKTFYVFDNNGLSKIKNDKSQLRIEWSQIYDMCYIRIFWMFLLQMGAGYLIIKYMNENKQENHTIALSKRQINLISEIFDKKIKIK